VEDLILSHCSHVTERDKVNGLNQHTTIFTRVLTTVNQRNRATQLLLVHVWYWWMDIFVFFIFPLDTSELIHNLVEQVIYFTNENYLY